MYRYWTGSSWSAAVTNNPAQAGPSPGLGQPAPMSPLPQQPQRRRGPIGWWIGGVALLVALAVGVWFAFQWLGRVGPGSNGDPGSNPTQNPCPKTATSTASPLPHPNDGRVHGGMLSYPTLGAPWAEPHAEDRVPFGRDVLSQDVMVQENYDGSGSSWVASVLVGELVAGDGFFSPQEGSEIVVKCIVGVFYGDAQVSRDDKVNKATKVDGKEAWLVETHLTFDIPGLETKGELAIILIVATSAEASSIYYASIPDTVPELVQPARDAMKNLKVGP